MSSLSAQGQYTDHVFKDLSLQSDEILSREFYDCVFERCSLNETVFKNCKFVNCVFKSCDLSLVRVTDCSFNHARFEDSKVIGVNWADASWPKEGLLNPIVFLRCVLSHSTFIGLNLRGIAIRECVAQDVDFREANLSQADMTYTDFSDSLFLHTDLTRADFAHAKRYNINASLNVLKATKFSLPEAMSLLHSLDILLVE